VPTTPLPRQLGAGSPAIAARLAQDGEAESVRAVKKAQACGACSSGMEGDC